MKSRHKKEEIIVHRDIAIEHHQPKKTHPHGSEHLQFKMFKGLEQHRTFLKGKISNSLIQSRIEMDTDKGIKIVNKDLLGDFRTNEALLPFFEGIC